MISWILILEKRSNPSMGEVKNVCVIYTVLYDALYHALYDVPLSLYR